MTYILSRTVNDNEFVFDVIQGNFDRAAEKLSRTVKRDLELLSLYKFYQPIVVDANTIDLQASNDVVTYKIKRHQK